MSDIDDVLNEINSTPAEPQGIARYTPNFGAAQEEASMGAFGRLKEAGSDIWNQGAGPVNVGRAALAGLEYLASPFTAFGKAIGDPLGRAVGDITGMPRVGQFVGDTTALAPIMLAPFPGAKSMGALAEGAGSFLGEGQAARSISENLPMMFAGKTAVAKSPIDEALEEVSTGPRMTSRAKTLEDEIALRWFQDQFKGGGEVPNIASAPGAPDPQDIRLLYKGNPKVGEQKYAKTEEGAPVNFQAYQNQGERPTYRTSHLPKEGPPDEAPISFYENAFRRQFEPSNVALGSPPSQMPLHPDVAKVLPEDLGVDVQRFRDMYLPGMDRVSITPPHIDEEITRIKGMPPQGGSAGQIDPNLLAELELKFGGSPAGAGINPQPAPFPGARNLYPWQNGNNVMFPAGEQSVHPIPMGLEARQNTNRLRTDLGVELDPEEIYRNELKKRPNLSAGPNAEATPKSVAQEDPLVAMKRRVDEVAPPKERTSDELPMPKTNVRTYDAKDIASVVKAIKDSRPTSDTPVYYSDLIAKIPGVSKAMLDKAYSKIKEGNPSYIRKSDPEKGQYLSIDPKLKTKTNITGKTEVADRALNIATNGGKLKQVYLRNLRPATIQKKDKTVEVGEVTMVRHLNKLISSGELKVYPEGAPESPLKKINADNLFGDDENDFIAEFVKKPKAK